MRPGIDRIRGIFDYERVGGSPLLGVRGSVIITHGRARRRMVRYACEVAATTARTGVPALIAEALGAGPAAETGGVRTPDAEERDLRGGAGRDRRRGADMNGPELSIRRGVIADLVRVAALEVNGVARVGRAGPAWRRLMGGRAVSVRIREDRVIVRLWIVARPGDPLVPLTAHVRAAVTATVERLLGLEVGAVTILVDGVGS